MKINELKEKLLNNSLDNSFLLMKYNDTSFLPVQYLKRISENRKAKLNYLNSVDDLFSQRENIFFEDNDVVINVFIIDEFKTKLEDQLSQLKDTIVICKKVAKEILDKCESVEFPNLEEWQVLDYMKTICPGLDDNMTKWLYKVTKGDINRIDNELFKIRLFNKSNQKDVFYRLSSSGGYNDLTDKKIFDLTNAIEAKDFNGLKNLLLDIDNIDVEAVGLVTILSKYLRNLIDIKFNSQATASSIGISPQAFNYLKNVGVTKYRQDELMDKYEFLLDFDRRLKTGLLDISKERMIDYIIVNMLK